MDRVTRTLRGIPTKVLLIVGGAFAAFPLFWLISSSLKRPEEITKLPPVWLPSQPSLDAFGRPSLAQRGHDPCEQRVVRHAPGLARFTRALFGLALRGHRRIERTAVCVQLVVAGLVTMIFRV